MREESSAPQHRWQAHCKVMNSVDTHRFKKKKKKASEAMDRWCAVQTALAFRELPRVPRELGCICPREGQLRRPGPQAWHRADVPTANHSQ